MIEIRLPKPGPEIENATITKWESKEGDKIQIGDILAIIKTPIGSFKVAAEEQGILENVLQAEGASIDFDEPIAIMKPDLTISDFPDLSDQENDDTMELPIEGGETVDPTIQSETVDETEKAVSEAIEHVEEPSEAEPEPLHLARPDTAEEENMQPVDGVDELTEAEFEELYPVEDESLEEEDTSISLEEETRGESFDTPEPIQFEEPDVEVSPAARKIAEREGIDLKTVTGTGDNGKILYIDVENLIKARDEAEEGIEEITVSGEELQADPEVETQPSESSEEEVIVMQESEEAAPGFAEEPHATDESISGEVEEPIEAAAAFEETPESTEELPVESNSDEPPESSEEPVFDADADAEYVEQQTEPLTPEETPASAPEHADSFVISEPEQNTESNIETEPDFEMPEPPEDLPFPDFDEISTQFHLSKKDDLIIPFNSNKKAFAEAQIDSSRNVPHYYLVSDIDITDAEEWLAAYNQKHTSRITIRDLFVKATGQALAMMPEMNAYVRPDRMILKRSINIGLTISVDEGVVTPVIPDVYHKPLHKVAETVRKNVDLAVKTKVILDYDTTFTISQLVEAGIKRHVPLITTPQTGCLALGASQKQVVPMDNFIAIRNIIEATLACDSRAVDASNASKFLQSIKTSIESLKLGNEEPDWIEGNEQLRLI